MTSFHVLTRDELLDEIARTWSALNDALDQLTPAQLSGPTDANGWRVQDHLCHMGAWHNWARLRLEGRPSWEGLGITEADVNSGDTDTINAAIRAGHAAKTPPEARTFLTETHDQLAALVAGLDDAVLSQPFRALAPDEPADRVIPPASHIIYESTAEHYREHLGWLRSYAFDGGA
ncbi:MAG: maleylpyruvate isomerase N-terminal domain-containing protein [Anaerolineae bacterium]|uniref:DinB family protein n=1 Tax=Promineifilum sp. TaxID=2664178 RepID=UPI001DA3AF5E|nr:maleylpyruvate isomerase N-terminal domain-containing protein [Anaerolineales bacterium]MCB8933976.1 maleylpyruvate isomerase N-terminal domain-containing protein [Promineifilum sp.]MCO5179376.1 maleylpyruvate isomerase N-terminal domain-containing protein [Promineifilum sp.]MCW5845909.1 maleylpyruvate isomerase N-terminal domain-containing protein [Anaerolineae bacterium]